MHPGFAAQWPVLRGTLRPLTIIVDAANVMGSRPDGWWRDRAGAAARLRGELAGLAGRGLAGLPELLAVPALELWYPEYALVVEGAARRMAAEAPPGGRVRVVAAAGSGDDTIAALAGELPGGGWWSPPTGNCAAGAGRRARRSPAPSWLPGLL